jgi:DNA-binding MarR family transcriptional regulator
VNTPASAGEPPWLDAAEREAWLALARLLVHLEPALDSQMRREAGFGQFEYSVMSVLSEAPERTLRMSELAFLAQGSLSRLSQVVSRLEKRGWVVREADPSDGRCTLAWLTDAGWEQVAAAAPGHVSEVRRLVFDQLTKAQVGQLTTIGRRIMQGVDPDSGCPGS